MASKIKAQLERIAALMLPAPLLFALSPAGALADADGLAGVALMPPERDNTRSIFLREPLNSPDSNLFAGHRSHSSHSSHRSHYSSNGGSPSNYPSPAPAPPLRPAPAPAAKQPEPVPETAPALPSESGFYDPPPSSTTGVVPRTPSLGKQLGSPAAQRPSAAGVGGIARRDRLTMTIMHVQLALLGHGYSIEAVDGVMSSETQEALRQFQESRGLKTTGTMTTETLNALDVKVSGE